MTGPTNWTEIAAVGQIAAALAAVATGAVAVILTLLQRHWQVQDARDADRLACLIACRAAESAFVMLKDVASDLSELADKGAPLPGHWEVSLMGLARALSDGLSRLRTPEPGLAAALAFVALQVELTGVRIGRGDAAEAAAVLENTERRRQEAAAVILAYERHYGAMFPAIQRRLKLRLVTDPFA